MIRTAVAILTLVASAQLALAATDDALKTEILGSWGQEVTCSAASIAFAADGTLIFTRPGDSDKSGTWSISEGVLSVTDETGKPIPDATIDIAGDDLTLRGTDRGKPFEQVLTRCAD